MLFYFWFSIGKSYKFALPKNGSIFHCIFVDPLIIRSEQIPRTEAAQRREKFGRCTHQKSGPFASLKKCVDNLNFSLD
jgi:hypothetical protein